MLDLSPHLWSRDYVVHLFGIDILDIIFQPPTSISRQYRTYIETKGLATPRGHRLALGQVHPWAKSFARHAFPNGVPRQTFAALLTSTDPLDIAALSGCRPPQLGLRPYCDDYVPIPNPDASSKKRRASQLSGSEDDEVKRAKLTHEPEPPLDDDASTKAPKDVPDLMNEDEPPKPTQEPPLDPDATDPKPATADLDDPKPSAGSEDPKSPGRPLPFGVLEHDMEDDYRRRHQEADDHEWVEGGPNANAGRDKPRRPRRRASPIVADGSDDESGDDSGRLEEGSSAESGVSFRISASYHGSESEDQVDSSVEEVASPATSARTTRSRAQAKGKSKGKGKAKRPARVLSLSSSDSSFRGPSPRRRESLVSSSAFSTSDDGDRGDDIRDPRDRQGFVRELAFARFFNKALDDPDPDARPEHRDTIVVPDMQIIIRREAPTTSWIRRSVFPWYDPAVHTLDATLGGESSFYDSVSVRYWRFAIRVTYDPELTALDSTHGTWWYIDGYNATTLKGMGCQNCDEFGNVPCFIPSVCRVTAGKATKTAKGTKADTNRCFRCWQGRKPGCSIQHRTLDDIYDGWTEVHKASLVPFNGEYFFQPSASRESYVHLSTADEDTLEVAVKMPFVLGAEGACFDIRQQLGKFSAISFERC